MEISKLDSSSKEAIELPPIEEMRCTNSQSSIETTNVEKEANLIGAIDGDHCIHFPMISTNSSGTSTPTKRSILHEKYDHISIDAKIFALHGHNSSENILDEKNKNIISAEVPFSAEQNNPSKPTTPNRSKKLKAKKSHRIKALSIEEHAFNDELVVEEGEALEKLLSIDESDDSEDEGVVEALAPTSSIHSSPFDRLLSISESADEQDAIENERLYQFLRPSLLSRDPSILEKIEEEDAAPNEA